jgi:hypothetical protein
VIGRIAASYGSGWGEGRVTTGRGVASVDEENWVGAAVPLEGHDPVGRRGDGGIAIAGLVHPHRQSAKGTRHRAGKPGPPRDLLIVAPPFSAFQS